MQSQGQASVPTTSDPFKILYNFRTKGKQTQKPRRKASACEKHYQIPQLTIRTRKMTAQIELKQQLDMEQNMQDKDQKVGLFPEFQMNVSEGQQNFLKNEEQLENGIPLSIQAQKQILFNFTESSQMSSYSKLEKALLGFGLQENNMDQQ